MATSENQQDASMQN
jgi:serine/threonine-protein phosphatase 2A regulatory subunit A